MIARPTVRVANTAAARFDGAAEKGNSCAIGNRAGSFPARRAHPKRTQP